MGFGFWLSGFRVGLDVLCIDCCGLCFCDWLGGLNWMFWFGLVLFWWCVCFGGCDVWVVYCVIGWCCVGVLV